MQVPFLSKLSQTRVIVGIHTSMKEDGHSVVIAI
jgi:hypothetical protein